MENNSDGLLNFARGKFFAKNSQSAILIQSFFCVIVCFAWLFVA